MDWKKIELLLEKYEAGETSLAEEKLLKESFHREDIPKHLKVYQVQFAYFVEQKEEPFPVNDLEQAVLSKLNMQPLNAEPKVIPLKKESNIWQKRVLTVAASVFLIAFGYLWGRLSTTQISQAGGQVSQQQIQEIKNSMGEMKQMLVLSLLKQPSASERIKGVNIAYESEEADGKVITALMETLTQDENVNVRLAAANALFVYRERKEVKDALIQALPQEEDPVLQIALINMLMTLKDQKSKETIEDFIQKEEIPKQVKDEIREKLKAI